LIRNTNSVIFLNTNYLTFLLIQNTNFVIKCFLRRVANLTALLRLHEPSKKIPV